MKLNTKINQGASSVSFLFLLMVALPVWLLMSAWTQRNLDFYLGYFQHTTIHVPYVLCMLITFVINGIALAANIVLEIIRMFLR